MSETLKAYEKVKVVEYQNNVDSINPVVSIIVLTYNHEAYIEQSLMGLLSQKTNFDFEILIGEDESSDGTKAICIDYANRFPNKIKLFLNSRENNIKVNGKPTGRFNYLYNLKKSRGTYICICEGDDYWIDDNKLQKQVDFLNTHPSYSFCWTRFQTFNQDTKAITLDFNGKYFNEDQPETFIDFDFERSLKGWHIGNLTLMYRRQFFNIEDHKKFKYFKDVHLIALLLKKGNGACINFIGAMYRVHNQGVHSSVTEYNGFRIGYNTHKEIHKDNPKKQFLRKKYLLSYQNFINANVKAGELKKAILMSIKLFFINWSIIDVLRNLKRIVTKFIKSLR